MPIRGKRGAPALRYFRQLPPRADLNAAICSKCVKKRALSEEGGQNSRAIRGRGSGVRFAITFFCVAITPARALISRMSRVYGLI